MIKKYEFTGDTKQHKGLTLRRIRALRDIDRYCVKKGDLGGWIETEDNLSHDGSGWVDDEAIVCSSAVVGGYARFGSNARFGENAGVGVNAWVGDQCARLVNNARVRDQ